MLRLSPAQFEAVNDILEHWGVLAELAVMVVALPVLSGMVYATYYGIRQTVRFRHRHWCFSPRSPLFVEEESCFPFRIGIRLVTQVPM